jgi:ZIP family zinc transporter
MVAASVFGLLFEAGDYGGPAQVGLGLLAGALLVGVSRRLIDGHEFGPGADDRDHAEHSSGAGHDHGIDPEQYRSADFTTLVLVGGVLTVHSFPEGVAVGVAFAEMGLVEGVSLAGFSVPVMGCS